MAPRKAGSTTRGRAPATIEAPATATPESPTTPPAARRTRLSQPQWVIVILCALGVGLLAFLLLQAFAGTLYQCLGDCSGPEGNQEAARLQSFMLVVATPATIALAGAAFGLAYWLVRRRAGRTPA